MSEPTTPRTHAPKSADELQRIKRARFTRRAFLLKDLSEFNPLLDDEDEKGKYVECFFCGETGNTADKVSHTEDCLYRRATRETRQLGNFFRYYAARRNGKKPDKNVPEAPEASEGDSA